MKFVLASYGTRGDIEPCVAVGRELLRRGHDVRMAIPPDLVGFAEAAGLSAVAYGPDLQDVLDAHRNFWTHFFRNFWKIPELIRLRREVVEPFLQCWKEIITTLTSLAEGADLLFTGVNFEDAAGNVAEYYDIPLATLHLFPLRANGQFVPFLPAPLGRRVMKISEWVAWRAAKKVEGVQRDELRLP
jgi:UDP:flavonoid glycosyltransferase YjiC (YdhE family)